MSVSRILHHSHPYFIYEVIMKYIWAEYDVFMKYISNFFSKNEVVNTAKFVYYQSIIKLLFSIFNQKFAKLGIVLALNIHEICPKWNHD